MEEEELNRRMKETTPESRAKTIEIFEKAIENDKVEKAIAVAEKICPTERIIEELDNITKTVANVPAGIRIFKSNKPYRLIEQGETFEEYRERRKIIDKAEKERRKGVNLFVSNPTIKDGKGKTFKRSNYTEKELGAAEITVLAKLKGVDLEKIKSDNNK
jgi:hypothetical protein